MKYLRHETCNNQFTGINHQFSNLFSLLAEAAFLGRIAVVSPLLLAGKHNGGKELRVFYDKHLDLSECRKIVKIIRAYDFEKQFSSLSTKSIKESIPVSKVQKDKSSVLVRHFKTNLFRSLRLANSEALLFGNWQSSKAIQKIKEPIQMK
jgi:hypothetical protein